MLNHLHQFKVNDAKTELCLFNKTDIAEVTLKNNILKLKAKR